MKYLHWTTPLLCAAALIFGMAIGNLHREKPLPQKTAEQALNEERAQAVKTGVAHYSVTIAETAAPQTVFEYVPPVSQNDEIAALKAEVAKLKALLANVDEKNKTTVAVEQEKIAAVKAGVATFFVVIEGDEPAIKFKYFTPQEISARELDKRIQASVKVTEAKSEERAAQTVEILEEP